MSTTIVDVTYIGGCEEITQTKGLQFSAKDTFEPDHATVTYQGSTDAAEAFLNGLERGADLTWLDGTGTPQTNSQMWLASGSKSEHPYMPEVVLSYVGVISDIPPPKVTDSLVTASVTTNATIVDPNSESYTEDANGNPSARMTLTAEYRAARTNYSWYETSEPSLTVPLYADISDTTHPLNRVTRMAITGSSANDFNPSTVSLAEMTVVMNTLSAELRIDDYQREIVIPNKLWRCSSSVQYVLTGQ